MVLQGEATRKGLIRASRPSGCVDFGLILRYALSEYRRGYSIVRVPCLSLKINSNSAHVDSGNSPLIVLKNDYRYTMYIISERINGMFTAVRKAIAARDKGIIQEIARRQVAVGANALDLNVGTATDDRIGAMVWLVETVREVTDITLCLDNPKLEVIKAGAEACGDNFIINSTTAKEEDLAEFLPFAAGTGADIIALTLDEKGVPNTAEDRIEIAARILIAAESADISPERIYIDPVILPVNIAQDQPKKLLETIGQFKLLSSPPPHVVIGLSNLAQGTTEKSLLTGAFLAMAMGAGLDSAILDPEESLLMEIMITGEVLLNNVIYNDDYLKAYRA